MWGYLISTDIDVTPGERGDIFVKGRLLFVETESNRQKSVDLDALKVWWGCGGWSVGTCKACKRV